MLYFYINGQLRSTHRLTQLHSLCLTTLFVPLQYCFVLSSCCFFCLFICWLLVLHAIFRGLISRLLFTKTLSLFGRLFPCGKFCPAQIQHKISFRFLF